VSLRTDIHTAFDAIAPATGGMAERVVETARREARPHHGRNRVVVRLRAPLSLIAVFLIITAVAAAFVGGRFIQQWNASHTVMPAGPTQTTTLAQLEGRALRLPVFQSIKDCHDGPYSPDSDYGSGPLYATGGSASRTAWGEYYYNVFYTDKVIDGPILVRVTDLYKPGIRLRFVGPGAGGPIVGTDVVEGTTYEQHSELVLYESQAVPTPLAGWGGPSRDHRFVWDFLIGMPLNASGGTGWQIDGPGFTEIFLAC